MSAHAMHAAGRAASRGPAKGAWRAIQVPSARMGPRFYRHHKCKPQLRRVLQLRPAAAGPMLKDVGLDYPLSLADDVDVYEPSLDLQDLCTMQLQALFALLARFTREKHTDWVATVYCRSPESLHSGALTLTRAALWPPPSQSQGELHASLSLPQQPQTTGRAAAVAASAAAGAPAAFPAAMMLQDRPRPSPSTATAASSCASASSSSASMASSEWEGTSTEASLVAEAVVALPNSATLVFPLSESGVLVGMLVVEHCPSAGLLTTASHCTVQVPFDDTELWTVRTFVPLLAKACAMDLRSALNSSQLSSRARLARSLLREARGPLSALQTFGSMLVPRLDAETTDKDIAVGMVMQSQRLQEVVAQLEAALKPSAAPAAAAAIGASEPAAMLPGGALAAIASNAAGVAVLPQPPAPAAGGAPSSSSNSSGGGVWGAAPVMLLPPAVQSSGISASSSSIRTDSLSLPAPPAGAWRAGVDAFRASSQAGAGAARPSSPASSTIDLVMDPGADVAVPRPLAKVESSRQASGASAGPSGRPPTVAAAHRGQCNVVDALGNLLSAGSKMAKLMGVALVALPPLHGHGGGNRGVAAAAALGAAACLGSSMSTSSSEEVEEVGALAGVDAVVRPPARTALPAAAAGAPLLLPRPQRPLMAGVAAASLQRISGYLLDLALQCSPRGGCVLVSARQAPGTGGIELCIQHTGRLHPDRLHAATRDLSGGTAAAAGASAAPASATHGMVSLDLAQQVVHECGGRLVVAYPVEISAAPAAAGGDSGAANSSLVEGGARHVGTSIKVWLPEAPK